VREYTLIYDGNCNVCQLIVSGIEKCDRNDLLEIVPSQLPGVPERFPWILPNEYAESLQLVRARD